MWKIVKWIELLKDWLYQNQIWYTAENTNFYHKWARSVNKYGGHRPKYFCNGQGSEMIGRNTHTLCPIITKVRGNVQNENGNLPTKSFWVQPIGTGEMQHIRFLKTNLEFHQI